jgi:nucleoside-diphosphate-sugar epimerase
MSSKILVLGGAGFLGRSIIKELMDSCSFDIACADVLSVNIEHVSSYKIDIINSKEVDEIIKDHEIVINCTGQVTSPINKSLKLNTIGMKNIAESVLKYSRRIIHISSVSVYGTTKYADETTLMNPETPYAVLKAFTEFMIKSILPQEQFMILRLSNLFGNKQKKGIVAYLIRSFHRDRKLQFNNNGLLKRYYLHVDDCSRIITRFIKLNDISGTYNIIGQYGYTVKELVQLFEEYVNIKFDAVYDMAVPLENINKISDEKLKTRFQPRYLCTIENYFKKISFGRDRDPDLFETC